MVNDDISDTILRCIRAPFLRRMCRQRVPRGRPARNILEALSKGSSQSTEALDEANAVRDVPARHGGGSSRGGKVAPLQVLLQFCGSELRARNGRQLNLNIQLCDV